MKNYVQPGDVINFTLSGTVVSGGVVVMGEIAGVAVTDGGSGDEIAVSLKGVYTLAKAAEDLDVGDRVFYDAGNSNVTATATDNIFIGHVVQAAASGVATVPVRLAQGGAAAVTS